MKKRILVILAVMAAVILCCAAVSAEEAADGDLTAQDFYEEYLGRIADPEDEISYSIGNAEYGLLDPGIAADIYLERLGKAKLVPADTDKVPDGEFFVMSFPDQAQFDFFRGEKEKNYVRVTVFDGNVVYLAQAVFEEEGAVPVSDLMELWVNQAAEEKGLRPVPEDEAGPELPEEGWVADSVNGTTWQDDRASLEVIPEGDGFKVLILWGSSAWESTEWTYGCDYDPETRTLTAERMICDDVVYDDNGNESRTTVLDQDCAAVFSLDGQDRVVITGAADDRLEGKTFTRVAAE